ncbi:hypothetical protein HID58_070678, partial [Brassica napus]
GHKSPNKTNRLWTASIKEKNRCRRKPTDHHHVFDRPAINGHGSGWENAHSEQSSARSKSITRSTFREEYTIVFNQLNNLRSFCMNSGHL